MQALAGAWGAFHACWVEMLSSLIGFISSSEPSTLMQNAIGYLCFCGCEGHTKDAQEGAAVVFVVEPCATPRFARRNTSFLSMWHS